MRPIIHACTICQLKSLQLSKDIDSAQNGARGNPAAMECLDDLASNLEQISMRIDFLGSMVWLATTMVDKSDERTVLKELNSEAGHFFKYVEIARRQINSTLAAALGIML